MVRDDTLSPAAVNLTAEQERELGRAWRRDGCTRSRNTLVEHNARLVGSIAKRYRDLGVPYEDLVAEGMLGLMRAASNFDPEMGYRFSTFAFRHIQHAMTALFAAGSTRVRPPRTLRRDASRWSQAAEALRNHRGEPPTDAEVAEALGWPVSRVLAAAAAATQGSVASVEVTGEVESPSAEADHGGLVEGVEVRELLSELGPREREIIEMLYGINRPWRCGREGVAAALGITAAAVRQIQGVAEIKLKRRAWARLSARRADGQAVRTA